MQTRYLWRLVYTLASPMTMPAGEYWFDHDLFVRTAPAASSTSDAPIVTAQELQSMIRDAQPGRSQQSATAKFSLLGTELTMDGQLEPARAVIVRPSSPAATAGADPGAVN